jgi:hypothetical protein
MFSTRKKIFEGVSQVETITLLVVCILLYTQPSNLVYFSNTILGKLLIVTSLVLASIHSTFAGFCIALLIVVFSYQTYEGMESGSGMPTSSSGKGAITDKGTDKGADSGADKDTDTDKDTDKGTDPVDIGSVTINKFKKMYCKDNKLRNEKGDLVEQKDISSVFKTVAFNKGECNPCDESCSFNITDTEERMNTEENLRPADSNSLPIVK